MKGDVPSGYYKGYDVFGEPKTILSGDPVGDSPSDLMMRAEREVSACISADHLYEIGRAHV